FCEGTVREMEVNSRRRKRPLLLLDSEVVEHGVEYSNGQAIAIICPQFGNNKRVRYLTEDEENRLFSTVPKEYHPLVILSLHTGMRKGELLNLKWEDIDFKQKRLMIRESKAGGARHLPMNDFVIQTLQCLPRMLHNPYRSE